MRVQSRDSGEAKVQGGGYGSCAEKKPISLPVCSDFVRGSRFDEQGLDSALAPPPSTSPTNSQGCPVVSSPGVGERRSQALPGHVSSRARVSTLRCSKLQIPPKFDFRMVERYCCNTEEELLGYSSIKLAEVLVDCCILAIGLWSSAPPFSRATPPLTNFTGMPISAMLAFMSEPLDREGLSSCAPGSCGETEWTPTPPWRSAGPPHRSGATPLEPAT